MRRKTALLVIAGILITSFFTHFAMVKVVAQQSDDVTLSLQLDPYTAANNAEDNQPFAVLVRASVPDSKLVAGIDATVTYDNTKLTAIKVLPGNQPHFANGYFGVTAQVDNDQSCKDEKTSQAKRLACAINHDKGIVSLTALNVDANQFLTTDPSNWPVPTTYPVTDDFIFATIIFQPQSVDLSGDITLDISNNNSNAYSWVDLAPTPGQNSRQVLSSQTPDPMPPVPISNETNCDTDFNRDAKIWGEDLAALFADFRKNCIIEYCRADINSDGKIWGEDLARLFAEYTQGQNYCQP